jgi:Tol biopolymer transport system component
VFVSDAFNLVSGDGNHASDIFLRDIAAQTTVRVSVSPSGGEADDGSVGPCLSADGRFVAFTSHATNLLEGDTNGEPDVYVRDLQSGTLERVSAGPAGVPANGPSEGAALSAEGRWLAFASMATNLLVGSNGGDGTRVWDVYLHDRLSGTTVRVSAGPGGVPGTGNSFVPAVSSDGRFVAFASFARNLISSDLNELADVYLRDMQAGATIRVSVGLGGQEPNGRSLHPSISGDGRYVAFESEATNLVDEPSISGRVQVYVRDVLNGSTTRVIRASLLPAVGGGTSRPTLSRDGRWLAADSSEYDLVDGDANQYEDVFLRGPLH